VPEAIQHYDIIEKIGEGGMGVVYKAMHRTLERPVAIKRLAAHLARNQNMLQRFLKEAKLQAKLSHANVVNIFDLLEMEGEVYLVMEYVSGRSVKELLQDKGRLSIPEALHVAGGVLAGLAFMHENSIVHRDIKPSNIIVSNLGQVKVTDFGIARLMEDDSGLTRFGAGVGTLQYMAPEMLKSGEVSFSVDLYALGVTLYEMLCGKTPFTGNTDLEIMLGHIEKAPPPLDLPEDEAGAACRGMVLKALAKTPGERFASAEEFLAQVRGVARGLAPDRGEAYAPQAPPKHHPVPDTAKEATMAGQAPLAPVAAGRARRKWLLMGLAVVLALGLAGYFLLAGREAAKAPPEPGVPASAAWPAPAASVPAQAPESSPQTTPAAEPAQQAATPAPATSEPAPAEVPAPAAPEISPQQAAAPQPAQAATPVPAPTKAPAKPRPPKKVPAPKSTPGGDTGWRIVK
jgi:serine/threonine-protein kinase